MKKTVSMLSIIAFLIVGLLGCVSAENSTSYAQDNSESAEIVIDSISTADAIYINDEETLSKWNGEEVLYSNTGSINFTNEGISATSGVVSITGNTVTISSEGSYVLSGTHANAQVIIDVTDDDNVQLILDGLSLTNTNGAVIYAKQSKNVIITAKSDTVNNLEDATLYTDQIDEEASSVIFSNDDLVINGSGTLSIIANYKDGISSDDDLLIDGPNLTVKAVKNGLKGKDSVKIYSGLLDISAEDCIKSTNVENDKGQIVILGGTITIDALEDGIQAEGDIIISDGIFYLESGDASASIIVEDIGDIGAKQGVKLDKGERPNRNIFNATEKGAQNNDKMGPRGQGPNATQGPRGQGPRDTENTNGTNQDTVEVEVEVDTENANAISSAANIEISGGIFVIDAESDAINADADVIISSGEFTISAGDDGIHADGLLLIEDGFITITKSYEGLEGEYIHISGGKTDLTASDDGLNASGDNRDEIQITISGGILLVDASGDGLDANGTLSLEGGSLTINGTTRNNNGVFDVDKTFNLSSGTIAGFGSSGMIATPSSSSQGYISVNLDEWLSNSDVTITNTSDKILFESTPNKEFEYVFVSSPLFVKGETLIVSTDNLDDIKVVVE